MSLVEYGANNGLEMQSGALFKDAAMLGQLRILKVGRFFPAFIPDIILFDSISRFPDV
jgi:hypothetical protein